MTDRRIDHVSQDLPFATLGALAGRGGADPTPREVLAHRIAGALQPVLPPRVRLHCEGSAIAIGTDRIDLPGDLDHRSPADAEDRRAIEGAVEAALSCLQYLAGERLGEPWLDGGMPQVTLRERALHAEFTDVRGAVMERLRTIPVDDLFPAG